MVRFCEKRVIDFGAFAALLLLALCLCLQPAAAAKVQARLVSEQNGLTAGEASRVGLYFTIEPGWHVYWKNPGSSGTPPRLSWQLPSTIIAKDINWPVPEAIPYGPLINYGYNNEILLPIEIDVAAGVTGDVTLKAEASWLVCADICIPEQQNVEITLPVLAHGDNGHGMDAPLFTAIDRFIPKAPDIVVKARWMGDKAPIQLSLSSQHDGKLWFFPDSEDLLDHAAPQIAEKTAADTKITLPLADGAKKPASLQGVLRLDDTAGKFQAAYKLDIELQDGLGAEGGGNKNPPKPEILATNIADKSGMGLISAVILAFMGGIILNAMPCVFPVLSMKALSLLKKASAAPRAVRVEGVFYTLGVLTCFLLLAGVLLILRAEGQEIGWGFQLQRPEIVYGLALLLFALGLNLSGFLELPMLLANSGQRFIAKGGGVGAFFTGMLSALVATPCTAPFMGTAMAFALVQPWPIALAVFLALGLGLAFPFLLFTFFPQMARILPKPGIWMENLRQFLAFPLYASAIWLIWVGVQQTGAEGVLLSLSAALALVFAVWSWKKARALWGRLLAILALLAIPALGMQFHDNEQEKKVVAEYEAFTPQLLQEAVGGERPVLINLTAAWCITCLMNEKIALQDTGVKKAFVEKKLRYIKGDWTNRNPDITHLLAQYNRSGVPLYLLYPARQKTPIILPQILTPNIMLDELEKLP
ncbi:MAG: protein-disulfide reductase DsbD family protein [Alphaproteobacteria bacterium]